MNTLEGHLPVRSPLHDILAPSGIAVVGASADPTKRGYKAMVGLINGGYQGHIYPINPKADHILGVQAWPSLTEMPGCPELALLCTPAATVPALIAECGRRGVRGGHSGQRVWRNRRRGGSAGGTDDGDRPCPRSAYHRPKHFWHV